MARTHRLIQGRHRRSRQDAGHGAGLARGALIGSHLGNLELCRALATLNRRVRLNVLVHTRHSKSFNQVLRMAGATQVELMQVTDLSVATALMLKSRIDQGEWVVIAGDRVPSTAAARSTCRCWAPGAMPVGPYVWPRCSNARCICCFACGGRPATGCTSNPSAPRYAGSARSGMQSLPTLAQRFAARLEHFVLMEPLQWFNFYPFWRSEVPPPDARRAS